MAIELTKADQLLWRRFLQTEAGMKGMLLLNQTAPEVASSTEAAIILEAGVSKGYKLALSKINDIIAARSEKEVDPSND